MINDVSFFVSNNHQGGSQFDGGPSNRVSHYSNIENQYSGIERRCVLNSLTLYSQIYQGKFTFKVSKQEIILKKSQGFRHF